MKTPARQSQYLRIGAEAAALAIRAGELLRRGFARHMRIHLKGRINPVTEYDLRSEQLIARWIHRHYPEHDILAEEGSDRQSQSAWRWIIDPLDGTVNYAHGFPVYCVSIGIEHNGAIVAGVVFDPERRELFSAVRGQGAKLNGRPIRVSSERQIERALLATGFAYDIGTASRNNLGLFARMAKRAQGVRRPGSAAIDLCWLAAGRIDGFWELKLHPWDTAAASLIVTEAGGKLSRIDGRPYGIFDADLLASNSRLHTVMANILSARAATRRKTEKR